MAVIALEFYCGIGTSAHISPLLTTDLDPQVVSNVPLKRVPSMFELLPPSIGINLPAGCTLTIPQRLP